MSSSSIAELLLPLQAGQSPPKAQKPAWHLRHPLFARFIALLRGTEAWMPVLYLLVYMSATDSCWKLAAQILRQTGTDLTALAQRSSVQLVKSREFDLYVLYCPLKPLTPHVDTLASLLWNTYDRSIVVDGEEASLVVFDIWEQDDSQWLQNHCMKMGDAYIIVYSVTDKVSFEKASELRIQLRRARQTEDIPIILVGNKSDLVRSREVSVDEGRACAVVFDCKFIETSAALHHNVKDLFEGIVRQIRLRKDSKEDNARRMANTKRRESIGKKAKRFLGRIVAKNNKKMAFKAKSKSCHDLSVL
ncbi:PREDICTED: GTP-binding protein RAD [Charadrius vociferus]|uniref:GTP-binding protein RAD n=1 Tax=Charadrius vociferus TaxID=50402 RepID=UPI000521237E|nr:PREDICTED: GTP-binding protein RAD [Charadrius vociferus]